MEREKKELRRKHAVIDTKTLVLMALLVAAEIILSRFVSIQSWNLRIGFGFMPIVISGMMLGPVRTGIVAVVADFIGATMFTTAAFFPGFTLTAFLVGIVYGVFLYKKQSRQRVILAVVIHQCILSLLLNTFWISVISQSPYPALLGTRLMQTIIMIPVELICITLLYNKHINRILSYQGNMPPL